MYLPKPSEGGNFTPPPAGTHPAICYRVIDLGTQSTVYNGERKQAHKVMLSWEITDPEIRMEDGRPFTISQRYTWSMHEKATLRKALESWRGQPFKDADFGDGGFNIKKLLGVGCLLSVLHAEKDGKVYANINAIMKLPKGMVAGSLVNEMAYVALTPELFDRAEFLKLSDGLQDTIKNSPEYQKLNAYGQAPSDYPADYSGPGIDDMDDSIPF
jgi:hypothetical protein